MSGHLQGSHFMWLADVMVVQEQVLSHICMVDPARMCEGSPNPNEGRLTGILQVWLYSEVQDKVCAVRIHAQQGP